MFRYLFVALYIFLSLIILPPEVDAQPSFFISPFTDRETALCCLVVVVSAEGVKLIIKFKHKPSWYNSLAISYHSGEQNAR